MQVISIRHDVYIHSDLPLPQLDQIVAKLTELQVAVTALTTQVQQNTLDQEQLEAARASLAVGREDLGAVPGVGAG